MPMPQIAGGTPALPGKKPENPQTERNAQTQELRAGRPRSQGKSPKTLDRSVTRGLKNCGRDARAPREKTPTFHSHNTPVSYDPKPLPGTPAM